jgi:hypothetical protein
LTPGRELGIVDDNDDDDIDDNIDGEAEFALGTTCLMMSDEDVLKGDAVEGSGYGATRERTLRLARSCSLAWRFSSRMRSLSAFFMGAKR